MNEAQSRIALRLSVALSLPVFAVLAAVHVVRADLSVSPDGPTQAAFNKIGSGTISSSGMKTILNNLDNRLLANTAATPAFDFNEGAQGGITSKVGPNNWTDIPGLGIIIPASADGKDAIVTVNVALQATLPTGVNFANCSLRLAIGGAPIGFDAYGLKTFGLFESSTKGETEQLDSTLTKKIAIDSNYTSKQLTVQFAWTPSPPAGSGPDYPVCKIGQSSVSVPTMLVVYAPPKPLNFRLRARLP